MPDLWPNHLLGLLCWRHCSAFITLHRWWKQVVLSLACNSRKKFNWPASIGIPVDLRGLVRQCVIKKAFSHHCCCCANSNIVNKRCWRLRHYGFFLELENTKQKLAITGLAPACDFYIIIPSTLTLARVITITVNDRIIAHAHITAHPKTMENLIFISI